jgi:hypothetical protein
MLESPAYRLLSQSAHRVLSRIEIELAHHGGKDNGELPVTFDDFENYGIDRHAIAAGIRELVALGIIEITEYGRAGNAEWRSPHKFRLTYRPTKYRAETNEWQRIKTEEAEALRKAARSTPGRNIPVGKSRTGKGRSENISQWGELPTSVGESPTEKPRLPVGESHTTAMGKTPTTLDISRERVVEEESDYGVEEGRRSIKLASINRSVTEGGDASSTSRSDQLDDALPEHKAGRISAPAERLLAEPPPTPATPQPR